MLWLILLATASLLLSLLALSYASRTVITVRSALKELRAKLDSSSTRSLAQLDAEMSELSVALASMSKTIRRLSSRQGMQELREHRKEEQLPPNFNQMTPAEKKTVLRQGLARGTLRAVKDNGEIHDT